MSKTLVFEIPDEVFSNLQKLAENRGKSVEQLVLEIILKNTLQNKNNDA